MCGIAGFIAGTHRLDPSRVRGVLGRLHHRGPDDVGWLAHSRGISRSGREWETAEEDPELLLLHRRLSIIDISPKGWQPMSSRDQRYHLIFNGELYNYIELRQQLRRLGHDFHTQTDSEVLLAAYPEWGLASLNRFIGMFAFAMFDAERRSLLLARDFFGIKPLYYAASDEQFIFASELTALLEFTRNRRQVNPSALLLYLRHGLSDQNGDTLLAGIHQLPPAHYLEISLDAPGLAQPARFWEPHFSESDLSFEDASRKLRDLFLESVTLHLRSDVPIGAALSGGIDSSAIVATMRKVAPSLDIHTFSYIAEEPSMQEERWADMMAASARARVHKIEVNPDCFVDDLDALLSAQEEPFGSTSVYAQHQVFRSAHEAGIKVMLDGQGADELLGGYRYYLGARFASLIRQHHIADALRLLRGAARLPGSGMIWLLLCSADYMVPAEWQKPLRALVAKEFMPRWVKAEWFSDRCVDAGQAKYCSGSNVLRSTLLRTMTETSLPHLLRYEDRNSMAFSIESRVPFLTPQLAEFILSLPEHYIVAADGTSKAVFRSAMHGIVPQPILDRKDKIGFVTPERSWLRAMNHWVQTTLRSDVAARMPFLDLNAMDCEWNAISLGRQPFDNRVWRWLNVIHWSQQFSVDYAA
jgi:asparagine synthase (glutamine-hydrolysing)